MEPKHFQYLSIFWALLILVLSLLSLNTKSLPVFSYSDKIVHLFFYFILSFLSLNSLKEKNKITQLKLMSLILFYGIIIEVLQELITLTRSADIFDVLANAFGIFLGYLLFNSKFNLQILKNKK